MAQYLSVDGFKLLGLPERALKNVPTATIQGFLVRAGARIDSYLRGAYELPLVGELENPPAIPENTYPPEVQHACGVLARHDLLVWRGFAPDEVDATIVNAYSEQIAWLRDVAAGRAHLAVEADQTSDYEGRARVMTAPQRGWHATSQAPREP